MRRIRCVWELISSNITSMPTDEAVLFMSRSTLWYSLGTLGTRFFRSKARASKHRKRWSPLIFFLNLKKNILGNIRNFAGVKLNFAGHDFAN